MKLFFKYLLPTVLVFAACKKQDIAPEPIGQPIEGEKGPDKTWQQLVKESSFTLFKAALQKADLSAKLKKSGSAYFTVMLPTDDAFKAAGWTAEKINSATKEELEGLLAYHIVISKIVPASLTAINGNIPAVTISERTLDGHDTFYGPYVDFLFLGKHGDSLMINGTAESKWGNLMAASDGIIYPINHVLQMPQETVWEYIENNPRFSMFLDAMMTSDSLYATNWSQPGTIDFLKGGTGIAQFTMFLPTNEAFSKSGFNTHEDILNYCLRSWPLPPPDYDENMYYLTPTTAMDSIIYAHGLEAYGAGQLTGDSKLGPVYFSNDLIDNSTQLSGLTLLKGQQYGSGPTMIHLDFKNNNGQPMIRRYQTNNPFIPLKNKDRRMLNGVVYEVDELVQLKN